MVPEGIAIVESRILRRFQIASCALTAVSFCALAFSGAWPGVLVILFALPIMVGLHNARRIVRMLPIDHTRCELADSSANAGREAVLSSAFDAFGFLILKFRGSIQVILVLAPDSIAPEQRRQLGLWLKTRASPAISAPIHLS